MPPVCAIAAMPWRTAATGSPCCDGTLTATMPAREAATTSVKVPPISMATCTASTLSASTAMIALRRLGGDIAVSEVGLDLGLVALRRVTMTGAARRLQSHDVARLELKVGRAGGCDRLI